MKNRKTPYFYDQGDCVKIGDFFVCRNVINKHYPLHQHDFYELEYISEGQGTHLINGAAYPVRRGDIVFITPMDFHGFEAQNIKTITLHFYSKDMSPEISALISSLKADIVKDAGEKNISDFERLIEIFTANGHYAELQLKNLTELIIVNLFGRRAKNAVGNNSGDSVSQAIGYININFRNKITLDIISQRFHISPSYFSREFKRRTGVCFTDYLAECRFSYAKKLLRNGNSVIDACLESGFTGVRNFTKRFKKLYGVTPSEYAKTAK